MHFLLISFLIKCRCYVASAPAAPALRYGFIVHNLVPHYFDSTIICYYGRTLLLAGSEFCLELVNPRPIPNRKSLAKIFPEVFDVLHLCDGGPQGWFNCIEDPGDQHGVHHPPILQFGGVIRRFHQRAINEAELFLCSKRVPHRSGSLFIILSLQLHRRYQRSRIIRRMKVMRRNSCLSFVRPISSDGHGLLIVAVRHGADLSRIETFLLNVRL